MVLCGDRISVLPVYYHLSVYQSNVSVYVELRGGPVEARYTSMCYTFAGMIAGAVSGYLISRMKEYVFGLSCALAAVGMALAFLSSNLLVLSAGGMFCGAAFSTLTPAGNYFAAQKAGENNRSFCITIFISSSNLGQALSPIAIAWIMGPLSVAQRFLGASAAFAVIFIFVFLAVCKTSRQKGGA